MEDAVLDATQGLEGVVRQLQRLLAKNQEQYDRALMFSVQLETERDQYKEGMHRWIEQSGGLEADLLLLKTKASSTEEILIDAFNEVFYACWLASDKRTVGHTLEERKQFVLDEIASKNYFDQTVTKAREFCQRQLEWAHSATPLNKTYRYGVEVMALATLAALGGSPAEKDEWPPSWVKLGCHSPWNDSTRVGLGPNSEGL
jgi:hypothetical protein